MRFGAPFGTLTVIIFISFSDLICVILGEVTRQLHVGHGRWIDCEFMFGQVAFDFDRFGPIHEFIDKKSAKRVHVLTVEFIH
jgi:hypothetical protein